MIIVIFVHFIEKEKLNKKNSSFYIICHTVILNEENNISFKNKQDFISHGHFIESEYVDKKHKNNIEEVFTKYLITFDVKAEKKITCENNIYKINLKSRRSIVKNKIEALNTYKFKNSEEVRFIHYVKFINEKELIDSFYLKLN